MQDKRQMRMVAEKVAEVGTGRKKLEGVVQMPTC